MIFRAPPQKVFSLTPWASSSTGGGRSMTLYQGLESLTTTSTEQWKEKKEIVLHLLNDRSVNPVLETARFVYNRTDMVEISPEGVRRSAKYIYESLLNDGYSPHTWRSQPLHLLPPVHYSPADPRTKACLDWIFLISSLNFSFWSAKEGTDREKGRFGVEWREGWGLETRKTWTGYWSLVAAINKALESDIPITDPLFYGCATSCPDSLIEEIFRPASGCTESLPLLAERISVMREVGIILNAKFGGSYAGLLTHFLGRHSGNGTALQLVQMVVEEFPSFRDESSLDAQKVFFWKRAQILVAETWAAFYPPNATDEIHPFFPYGIGQLTMFADYRVPQILHHLQIMSYPPSLLTILESRAPLPPGSVPEISIRAASVLAVEALRDEIGRLCKTKKLNKKTRKGKYHYDIPSVIIDFFLWDLAKKVEEGEEKIEGIWTNEMVPAHRTRSIWY